MEEWLTTGEAAEALGVTQARIRQLCGEGYLPATKRGRDWWIKRKDLEEFADLPPGKTGSPRRLGRPRRRR